MANRDRIFSFLESIFPSDASNAEIALRTGIEPHQQVFAITAQMMQSGVIKGVQHDKEWRFSARAKGPVTEKEQRYLENIRRKDTALRRFLNANQLPDTSDFRSWFSYLTKVKDIQGNLNNGVSFLATLLAKEYLAQRFNVTDFDASAKAQGATGPDIEVKAPSGALIRCELKTTSPYKPGFGAKQKTEIMKDLRKLSECKADYRLMMVTDPAAFAGLRRAWFASHAAGIDIVNLITGESYRHTTVVQSSAKRRAH